MRGECVGQQLAPQSKRAIDVNHGHQATTAPSEVLSPSPLPSFPQRAGPSRTSSS